MITILINFILGMLVIQVCFHLLDGITSLLLTMIEAAKGYFSLKIMNYNAKAKMTLQEEDEVKNIIGFRYEEALEEDEEVL